MKKLIEKKCKWINLTLFSKVIFVLFAIFLSLPAIAQELSVKGRVVNANNQPMLGVSVVVKSNNANGASTGVDGDFTIKVKKGDVLMLSYIGYTSKSVIVTSDRLTIALSEDATNLEEVIVVGYGKQSRATLTNAVSTIDVKSMENISYANASSALQGRVPGLRVVNTSGQPGDAPSITLRGGTSISSTGKNSPLYIVDGVERQEINGIRADDIETMTILKDATSTAIYGAKGSNGVIVITTKGGKLGRAVINYKYRFGLSDFRKESYRQVNSEEYLTASRLGVLNSTLVTGDPVSKGGDVLAASIGKLEGTTNAYGTGGDLTEDTLYSTMYLTDDNKYLLSHGFSSMIDPVTGRTILFQDTDWYDKNYQTGIKQEHIVDLSGATEKSSYYTSVSMLSDEGIIANTKYDIYTGMLNADHKIKDNFKVYGKFNFSHETSKQPGGFSTLNFTSDLHKRNMILRSPNMAPTTKFTFADGSYAPGTNQMMANPMYVEEKLQREQIQMRWTGTLGFNWDITDDLQFSPRASIYQVNTYENASNDAFLNGTVLNSDRDKRSRAAYNYNKQFDAVLTYNKTFAEKHNLNTTFVASYISEKYFNLQADMEGSPTDITDALVGVIAGPGLPTSREENDVSIGFVGRVVYDYDKRYLFQASLRRDGSSRFGADSRWGTFMGVSAGWNIHNENFFKNLGVSDVINNMKFRASYGETGNNSNLGKYTWQGSYSTVGYGGSSAVYKNSLSNYDLQWETTRTLDIGFDMGFFGNRVTLLFDYFNKETLDLLQSMSLPVNTGFSSIKTNFAVLENKGVEIDLGVTIIDKKDMSWDVNFNASHVTTTIKKLPTNGLENNRINGIEVVDPNNINKTIWVGGFQEGEELGQNYTYVYDGVYSSWEEAQADGIIDMKANGGNGRYVMDSNYMVIDTNGDGKITSADKVAKGGGDVKWVDLNQDGVINDLDKAYAGSSTPDWVGGFGTSFRYKNISLRVGMDYAIGHVIYDYESRQRNGAITANLAMMPDMNNMWTPTNTNTSVAQFYADGDPMGNYNRGSSNLWYKGDYLCLRDVTVGYTLPDRLFNKMPIQGIYVYVTGQNLYYFSEYPGYQPEKGGNTTDDFQYPMPRTFSFGVNVTF